MSSIVILSEHSNFIQEFQSKFKQYIDYIKTFLTSNEAENYIIKHKEYLIVFIVSTEVDESVIKHIHDLRQLHQIYVYNPTNETDRWTNEYKKVCIQYGNHPRYSVEKRLRH